MIRAHSVCKSYNRGDRRVDAVRDVNLEVAEGEFLVIEGISGSGKSTLLQLLGGLDHPDSGTIHIGGQHLGTLSQDGLARLRLLNVGFIFQSFNLIPTLNARDNVEVAMISNGLAHRERRERALALLELVDMAGRWSHVPSKLSGGEQQRVAIARALANQPRVVLADEPTGDLDTNTGVGVIEMLKNLTERNSTTVVVVTHAPYVAEYATRRAVMSDGRLNIDRSASLRESGSNTTAPAGLPQTAVQT